MQPDADTILVTADTAIKLLTAAADDGTVHTLLPVDAFDLGADWTVEDAVKMLRTAHTIGFVPHPAKHELAAADDEKVIYFDVRCPDGLVSDVPAEPQPSDAERAAFRAAMRAANQAGEQRGRLRTQEVSA